MTIDFAVYQVSPNKYELYVKDNIDNEPVNVPFRGNALYELEIAIYEVEEKYKDSNQLKEGGIYEFGYDNSTNKFILFRPRLDKIDPNFITVAQNIWNDIKNPYTKEELLELLSPIVLEEYREYQNTIKRGLIEKYCKNKAVLDLGSGRGGDLGKYDSAKVTHLWCIEPNPKNYTELLRRLYDRKDMKNKTTLIKTVAQDTEEIVNGIKNSVIYTYPIIFESIVTFENNSQYISYTSIDNLRSIVSHGYDIDRNSFIILDVDDKIITDEDLYGADSDKDRLKKLKVVISGNIEDVKKQEIGGDYQNWFPKKDGVDYTKLRITKEGMYSLTKYSDSLAIIRAMENIIGKENLGGLTILDGTANVGGDTIRFGMNYNKVISVELTLENFTVLKNNVEVFGLDDKVEMINGDITKVWNDVQTFTDVLFLDPPWGGKDYIGDEEEVLNLFLSGISVSEFVGKVLLSPDRPSYIFIKLPVNYDINSFKNMPYVSNMQVFTIRKFYLLCLTVDERKPPVKKADILSSFFSLSFFFFKDELGEYKDLNNLVKTIDQTLNNDGYFIGTTIDGNKTKELLNSCPDRKFDFNGGYIRFIEEEKETIELLIRGTIVETQIESLVDFELLEAKLLEHDIELVDTDIFKPGPLSEKENTLNSLYRYFVFKRKSKTDIYIEKSKIIMREETRPIFNSVESGRTVLSAEEILKTLSLTSTVTDMDMSICRDDHFFQLLDLRRNIIQEYNLLDFNYVQDESDNTKKPDYLITKYYENKINSLKEYLNSSFPHKNLLKITSVIDNSPIYHIKNINSIVPFDQIYNDPNVLISCIYQLYYMMIFLQIQSLTKDLNLQFSSPQIILEKDNRISSIKYGNLGEIKVVNGIVVKILNTSYTTQKIQRESDLQLHPHIDIPTEYSYDGIEILYYLNKSYKLSLLNNIKLYKNEIYNFLIKFLTIKNSYTIQNESDNQVQIYNEDHYDHEDFIPKNNLYIKQALELRENKINLLTDDQFEYYKKVSNIFKIFKSLKRDKSKNKVSNKITKWMEVLTTYLTFDKEKTYKVLSNGYMPQMFLYALKSVTESNFDWYANDSEQENKDLSKCKNWMNADTTLPEGINYIDKKMNEKIDIYASYSNKDVLLNETDSKKQFLADILTGLVSLKNGGIMFVNIKSFFTVFEMSLLGYVSSMFKEFYIYKPLSSDMLVSEVFIIGKGYERNEDKITYLKTNEINNSLNIKKYSTILLAAYKFYGRQMYFMDKNMECYEYLSNKYTIDELNEDVIKKDSNKMLRYYLNIRKNIQKNIYNIINTLNLDIVRWENYGCVSHVKRKNKVKIIGTVYTRNGIEGDFDWQIRSKLYEDSLFLFNDNEEHNKLKKAGGGNAIIRKYNKYALPDRPRSVGIVTGKDGRGYDKLTEDIKEAIDKTIEEVRDIIRRYKYKKVYYSAIEPNGLLGTSIFKVGKDVLEYITDRIHSLGEPIQEDVRYIGDSDLEELESE
jgi:predicted RNA methylase